MKNKTLLLMALLIGVAMFMHPQEAKAVTTINSCPYTISTPGDYVLGSPQTWTTSSPCITITANSATQTNLDCQNNYIDLSGSGTGNKAIDVSSAQNVYVYNCGLSTNAYGTNNWLTRRCISIENSSYIQFSGNAYAACINDLEANYDVSFTSEIGFDTAFQDVGNGTGSTLLTFRSVSVDNTASYNSTAPPAIITLNFTDEVTIYYCTLAARAIGADDIIIIAGRTGATRTSYIYIHDNTLSGFYDCAVEFLGKLYSVDVEYNTITSSSSQGAYGVCGYAVHGSDVDYAYVHANTVSNTGAAVGFTGVQTGLYIEANEQLSPLTTGQYVGATNAVLGTNSNVTLVNNLFKTPVSLTSSGIVDGGGNHCDPTGSYPSPLPITCTWP